MKFPNQKKAIAIAAGALALSLGTFALVQALQTTPPKPVVNSLVLQKQTDIAESIYSRNLQAIRLSDAIATTALDSTLLEAAKSWSVKLKEQNMIIKTWFSDNDVPYRNEQNFEKRFNIPEGQIRNALQSNDDRVLAETMKILAVRALLIKDRKSVV